MLPQIYSSVEEIDSHPSALSPLSGYNRNAESNDGDRAKYKQQQLQDGDSRSSSVQLLSDCPPPRHNQVVEEVLSKRPLLVQPLLPHLFLHFDINETILVGDVAGNDTVEDCLNKIIAKVALVSTTTTKNDCMDERGHNNILDISTFEPKLWWDGSELNEEDNDNCFCLSYQPTIKTAAAAAAAAVATHSSPDGVSSTATTNSNCHVCKYERDRGGIFVNRSLKNNLPPPLPPPPPLYTGWTIPKNTCSYYKTKRKRYAKQFTLHHPQYRSMYELLQSKILLVKDGLHDKKDCAADSRGGNDDGDSDDSLLFRHFVPAFFHTLMYYFPSMNSPTTTDDTTEIPFSDRIDSICGGDNNINYTTYNNNYTTYNNNDNTDKCRNNNILKSMILPVDHSDDIITRHRLLPRPPKTTLVLRTFGTDLDRVIQAISQFAKGKHPDFPKYFHSDLIVDENNRNVFCGGWKRKNRMGHASDNLGENDCETKYEEGGEQQTNASEEELIYELHPTTISSSSSSRSQYEYYSGDDEILAYLQTKTFVGIQDNYSFWNDHDCAPWAGKPIWARTRGTITTTTTTTTTITKDMRENIEHQEMLPYNHHHILLDDNIHNDSNDGAGAVRIPIIHPTNDDTTTGYISLHGNEALEMHGRHLIRVPTVCPILDHNWFIQQIEDARWRVCAEEVESLNNS